ncbi:hypothetical protein GMOD_00009663 [Pyrenophora seminiperda CCB06]|uniref:Uncharacterized protein n=1 Tax=Pyrenophora seminiperda CCB06 TaxID=1302712 RepID=A0A3M7MF61_9PLEO|nr:hypothetical protein GMOD_00009663 [Pyrenophora seminiperda CCB06]
MSASTSVSQQEREQDQQQQHQRELAEEIRNQRIDIRVQRHPAYHAWVASGGLAKFAAENNLPNNFVETLGSHGGMMIMKFYARLRTVAGLSEEIAHRCWGGKGEAMSNEAAEAAMADAEGWYSDSSDDADDDNDDSLESAENKAEVKAEEQAGGLTNQSVSPSDNLSEQAKL